MRASAPVIRIALRAACLLLLPGCNALLGIDPPKDSTLLNEPDASGDNGDGPEDDAGPSTPQISEEEPSPYAWASWPMPNPRSQGASNPQMFGVRAQGLMRDALTKLEWQQTVPDMRRTREAAEAYCDSLPLAGGGFRLPSRIELVSLLDVGQETLINAFAFPNTPPGKYWTSSRYAGSAASGWLVNFEFGTSLVFIVSEDEEHLVRCVRGGTE